MAQRSEAPTSTKPAVKAFLQCRSVKMKCITGGGDDATCERCARKSLKCIFQDHRRGRKPGTQCVGSLKLYEVQQSLFVGDDELISYGVVQTRRRWTTRERSGGIGSTTTKSRLEQWKPPTGRAVQPRSNSRQLFSRDCHPFQIQFYGTHLRLQLFSLPLQDILAQAGQNVSYHMEALWISYSSALEMLHLICRYSSWLYFAQDSIHVMTAYSAAFLIKLLMSTPLPISSQIAPAIHGAISGAARSFSQQAAPSGSSCALQSLFLNKILAKISKDSSEELVARDTAATESHTQSGAGRYTRGAESSSITATSARALSQMEAGLTLDFGDDEEWAGIMAEAGFNAQDGVFFA